jgi:hypothetical protein
VYNNIIRSNNNSLITTITNYKYGTYWRTVNLVFSLCRGEAARGPSTSDTLLCELVPYVDYVVPPPTRGAVARVPHRADADLYPAYPCMAYRFEVQGTRASGASNSPINRPGRIGQKN